MEKVWKRSIFSGILIFFTLTSSSHLWAGWYKCVVYGSSHTGRYTFKIRKKPCAVYWLEIDSHLKIQSCDPPKITALKPSARDDLTVVKFNLATGFFSDYLAGFIDRGKCSLVPGRKKTVQ